MINSDRVSLFITLFGHRGGCKTLFMTSLVCRRLLKAYYLEHLKGIKLGTWANYPVGFKHKSLITGKMVYLQPAPLNMEAFYTFDDDLAKGWVFISEIDQWFDRQDWSLVTQKLMNKVLTQIRKKKLSLVVDLQDMNWMNARGQFQTDIMVKCREAAFSPWGRRLGLDLGEAAFLGFMDKSGVMTGYSFDETGRSYNKIFWGKRFWNCYDTDYMYDPVQTATRYKLKVPTKIIEMGGNSTRDIPDPSVLQTDSKERDLQLISDLIYEYQKQGHTSVPKGEFRRCAMERGLVHAYHDSIDRYVCRFGSVGIRGPDYTFGGGGKLTPTTPVKKRRGKVLVKV